MQSDVVPEESCKAKAVNVKLISSDQVAGDRTLVQEVGIGGEKKSEGMEIDNFGERDLCLNQETSGLEGKRVSGNNEVNEVEKVFIDVCVSKEGKDSGKSGEIKAASPPSKANFNSFAQQLFQKPVSDDSSSMIVQPERRVDEVKKSTVELKKQAEIEVLVDDQGVSKDRGGVNVVVDLEECVRNEAEDGEKKAGFCVSDLVWGKVRSHPWWPGQIFEPGHASDKARKYSKSKAYLVGYFGDQTFAWNVEANLKPFVPNFSEMVKQTNMEAFRHALGCVLDETSRRVEYGLSCGCIADDVYNQLKIQVIKNTGVRKQSRILGGRDRFFTASSFEPMKFLDYVRDLAQGPLTDVSKLEHVIAQAQMASFYRWKGIYHLAEFGPLIGYVNNEADAPVTAEKERCEVTNDETPPIETMEEDPTRPQKRKKLSEPSDSGHSIKKVKCLSDLIGKKSASKKGEKGIVGKPGSKSISSSGKKQEAKLLGNDSKTGECSPSEITMQVKDSKSPFKVGERFLRVAGQLSQRSPLLKSYESSLGKTKKNEGNSKRYGTHKSNHGSLAVIVSQLRLAAIKPLNEHSLLSNMVTFIFDFRNSVVPDNELLQKHEDFEEEDEIGYPEEGPSKLSADVCFDGDNYKEKASESEISTTSHVDAVEDARCTNQTVSILEHSNGVSTGSLEMDSIDGSVTGASVEGALEEKMQREDSPTALILKFSDVDSIPTEAELNKIFSHFGPLKESKTEVLTRKSCVRVVFKRRSDAETAFSSSGKFETFGPSLVCYRLNYAPSPRKSPLGEAKRRKKVESL